MEKLTLIVNPAAGKGAGRKLQQRLLAELRRRNMQHDVRVTGGPGDAMALARSAVSSVVVAVGGDGTVNEVANGLLGSSKVLAVIPTGSGNDFIKSIGVPHAVNEAVDCLSAGTVAKVDVGTVRCTERSASSNSSHRCFVNGVGVGFDAAVAARTSEITYLRGTALYVMAVFQTLGKYRAPLFDIAVDEHRQRTRNLLVAIGNGRCAGGGFYLTPDAEVSDGLLDVSLIDDLPLHKILRLMPKMMRANHHDLEGVNSMRGKNISLSAETPFFVHADGEVIGRSVTQVDIEIRPQELEVIVGEKAAGRHG